MKTQTAAVKIQFPKAVHIVAWEFPKISYRIVGKNGETLLSCSQGFEREAGMKKNLAAVSDLFLKWQSVVTLKIYWVSNRNSKKIIEVKEVTV